MGRSLLWTIGCLWAAAVAGGTFPVAAQPARIVGQVRDDITGQPVRRARVQVTDGQRAPLETRTDTAGAYEFPRVTAGRVSFRVEADTYSSLLQDITIEAGSTVVMPFFVTPIAIVLDRLQARAGPSDRSGGGSRETVAGEVLETSPGQAVTARVPGARVLFTGGAVGTATQILLRGFKSMNLPGDPLFYVDGILMPAPTAPSARNRAGESILDMIDPSTIERIEVLSGAAASAAFGLGSNNGVVLIFTKR